MSTLKELLVRALGEENLTQDELRTAYFNLACAYSKLGKVELCSDPLTRAVNDFGVKYAVVMEDPDLENFRRSKYFDAIQTKLVGGVRSDAQYVALKAEATSPFRLVRLYLFGALGTGATIGIVIITSKLIAVLGGGEGDLQETIKNFCINLTAIVVFYFLFYR